MQCKPIILSVLLFVDKPLVKTYFLLTTVDFRGRFNNNVQNKLSSCPFAPHLAVTMNLSNL